MCGQEGDEAVRGPSTTLRDYSQVESGNHSSSMLVGNLSLSDCLTERPGGGSAMRPADDLEGPAPDREVPPRRISRRCSRGRQGNEAVRGSTATFGSPPQVRHHHQAKNN